MVNDIQSFCNDSGIDINFKSIRTLPLETPSHIGFAGMIPAIAFSTGHPIYPCNDGCPVIILYGVVVVGFGDDDLRLMMMLDTFDGIDWCW